MAGKPLLVTLLPSSGVDLGRWLLAHYGVDYTERPHAPIFHVLALKSWGQGKDDYPLFVHADGKTKTAGCLKIAELFDPDAPAEHRLLPDAKAEPDHAQQVDDIVKYAYWTLGDDVVNWSYWNFLKHKSVVWPSLTTSVPWYEKLTCALAFGTIRTLMYKGLKLNQGVADTSLQSIYDGWDKFDAMLADGRRYLVGDRLSYADLATAAALGPMILAQGYHGMLPNEAKCPVFMQKVYKELRQRPTGLFIQRIYDTHRPAQLLCV
ncbi:glutathione S-transferase C-terminal domain-containing protein [uncultured Roseobacter sp.]|uniref:glutathione S-transferase C-terminal domain-containing protein n=1 Tax=uncultured Roseobacter sp. TaxID=114847 RepID=UPI002612FAFB|nr:glutathione S-transferase C-terminal domain-containing protein [uncultured Roseobacter sp.]